MARRCLLAPSRALELENDPALVVLRENAHHLPESCSAGITRHKRRLSHADDNEAMLSEVVQRRFLHHQVTRKPVQLLDNDGTDAVRVKGSHRLGEGQAIGGFDCTAHVLVCEFSNHGEAVNLRTASDRRPLPWKSVAAHLALAADSKIAECLDHDAGMGLSLSLINTNFLTLEG